MFGVKSLWTPVTGCGEDWQRKGGAEWREAAGRIWHLPVPDMTHRGYNEDNPMRSADGIKTAAGQRPEH